MDDKEAEEELTEAMEKLVPAINCEINKIVDKMDLNQSKACTLVIACCSSFIAGTFQKFFDNAYREEWQKIRDLKETIIKRIDDEVESYFEQVN